MSTTITANMNLVVPGVGSEQGPDWAQEINSDLGILDQHDHSPGLGVPITTAGININANLPLNGNNLTTVKTVNFSAQGSSLSGVSPNLGCVYVSGNELYYNDEAGNVVQITSSGSVNAGAGSITGLPSGTASASFSGGTFIWQSATSTAAAMDARSYIYRNSTANSKGLTLSPPNAMAADFGLVLPSIPGSTSFVTLDTSGNLSGSISTSGGITGSNIAASTIALANMAANSVDTSQLVAQSVTQAKLAPRPSGTTVSAGGIAISSSCGTFTTATGAKVQITNFSVTITTTGRPVRVFFQSDGSGGVSFIASDATSGSIATGEIDLKRGATTLTEENIQVNCGTATGGRIQVPAESIDYLDMGVNGSPGTYTYTAVASTDATLIVQNAVLVAYEI